MRVEMSRLGRVFGDRILVKRLERPEKIGSLLVPTSYLKGRRQEQELWFGTIQDFGLDSRYCEAYDLKKGDIVGIESLGDSCTTFEGSDGETYCWVAEEFVVVKDLGLIKAFRENLELIGLRELQPLGTYSAIELDPEEEKRNGVLLATNEKGARTGTVIAVSPGKISGSELLSLHLNRDSRVLVGKYSGSYLNLGKRELLLAKEDDIVAEIVAERETANV